MEFHKGLNILTGTNMQIHAITGNKSEMTSYVYPTVAKLRDDIYKLLLFVSSTIVI
jgi:hypothetical protein